MLSTTDFSERADITDSVMLVTAKRTAITLVIVSASEVAPVAPKTELDELCEVKTPPPFES
jgi:hypothetical protein